MAIVTIGEQIKRFRKEHGLTQKQLADACGMVDSAIRKYESGSVRPKMATVFRIAKALGVEPLELTVHDPNYPITFTVPIDELQSSVEYMFGLTQIQRRINSALNKLNSDGQDRAAERVEELTEIPRYRAETALQSPPAPQEGQSTSPPPAAPEMAPQGK